MCLWEYYQNTKNCKDKKQFRYQMVVYAQGKGIKPAARDFNTTANTVRKWKARLPVLQELCARYGGKKGNHL